MTKTYTSTQIMEELNLKYSTFYYVLKNNLISVKTSPTGRYVWDLETFNELKKLIENKTKIKLLEEDSKPAYKTTLINNRRYLGNKYKLLDFIKKVVDENCKNVSTFADIFAGTGSVSSAFIDKKLITNDIMYFNYLCHVAWFSPEKYSQEKIINIIDLYNHTNVDEDNYVSINFGDTYFSKQDCRKIGYIREDIETLYKEGNINFREKAILITSLLYAMDKIANTCGHYDAYIRNGKFEKKLELSVPLASNENNDNNQCFNMDSNELVKNIEADLVYIDPPYNSRQYCDAYHLLENIAKWEKPEVYGVAKKMDRTNLKSEYCTSNATQAFADLIKNIKAKYILLSYNNMGNKGNERSNARITDEDIMTILSAKGKVLVFSQDYKAFTAGKSDIQENEERLFLCECYDYGEKELIQSPLNYTGGKYKLLPQILPHFPKNVEKFVDLFSGGGNVGINVPCNKVIFNDKNDLIKYIFGTFKNLDKQTTFDLIDEIIEKYKLSNSSKNGYEYYKCTSSEGLGAYNNDFYLKLRNDFNNKKTYDYYYYIQLYTLIIYSFNNQIRFNKKGEFNLPVGKRDFNDKMREKLSLFIDRLKSGDYTFLDYDFRKLPMDDWNENTFVYADPPYLITCATYNEQDGWTEQDEKDLLKYLDILNEKNIKFALSNVLRSKGKENKILLEWIQKNQGKYRVIPLNYTYSNSNYQTKDRLSITEEILVVNY